jgi:Zn ribbon nucleic-acid-binding protein
MRKIHLRHIRSDGDTLHVTDVEGDEHEVADWRRAASVLLDAPAATQDAFDVTPTAAIVPVVPPDAVPPPEPMATGSSSPANGHDASKRRCPACRAAKSISAFKGANRSCMKCVRRASQSRSKKRRARREAKQSRHLRRGEGIRPRQAAARLRCLIDVADGDGEVCQRIVDRAHASQHAYEAHDMRIDSTRLFEHFEDVEADEDGGES